MNPVLILAHKALSRATLESVLAQDVPVVVLAVDNDSSPNVRSLLADYRSRISVQSFTPQLGVSRGWNFGLAWFFGIARVNYVWVINDDIEVRPDTYRELIDDGGQFVTAVGVDSRAQLEAPFVKAIRPNPDFSCYLIRRECWKAVGPFDEAMELYASDGDMHVRMHRAGIAAYTIGLPFLHIASGSIKSSSPLEAQAIHHRADLDREAFQRKHGCRIGSPEYAALFDPIA